MAVQVLSLAEVTKRPLRDALGVTRDGGDGTDQDGKMRNHRESVLEMKLSPLLRDG